MLGVMAGYDENDPASVNLPVDEYLAGIDDGVQDMKIALAAGEYIVDSDAGVSSAVRVAAEVFKKLGAQVTEVEVGWLR
jgi:aspartyl-tRNA(Asn)/glutamyl-tRNA(Gln) amidotransferase subunit A